MKHQCIEQLQQKAEPVGALCRVLGVSASGYYASRRRKQAFKQACPISAHLQAAFAESGKSYGSRRLRAALAHRLGRPVAASVVYRLLARHGWRKVAPDTRHPKSDPIAQEEWKKNSPRHWRLS